ncbi:MAG TPA: hypothetical protein VLG44_03780 [Chlamydiales bacterium]|nr:hypothetical protein [Chlamydiales bacterium]
MSSLSILQRPADIIAEYWGTKELHKVMLIKNGFAMGMRYHPGTEMDFIAKASEKARIHTERYFKDQDEGLDSNARRYRAEREAYVHEMQEKMSAFAKRSRANGSINFLFFAPGTLESPIVGHVPGASTQLVGMNMARWEGLQVHTMDLTCGFWDAAITRLYQLLAIRDERILQHQDPKITLEIIARATTQAYTDLAKMAESYSADCDEGDCVGLKEWSDCTFSVNISSELFCLIAREINVLVKQICPYAFNDEGIFKYYPSLVDQWNRLNRTIDNLRYTMPVRHFTLLKVATRPGKDIFFADTTRSFYHPFQNPKKRMREQEKLPTKAIEILDHLFQRVAPLTRLQWFIETKDDLAMSFDVEVRELRNQPPTSG